MSEVKKIFEILQLRDYQRDAVLKILKRLTIADNSLCISATGTGKTRIMSAICLLSKLKGKKSMIVVDKIDLVDQHLVDLEEAGLKCFLEQGDRSVTAAAMKYCDVIICTRQTLVSSNDSKRITKFDANGFWCYDN